MNQYLKYVLKTNTFRNILEKIESTREASGVNRDVASLLSLCLNEEGNKDLVVVAPNIYQAQKIYDEISSLTEEAYFYPEDEFISTELLSESIEFELARVNTLEAIFFGKKKKIIVTSLTGLLNKTARKDVYKENIITLKKGGMIKPSTLINKLINSGYKRTYTIEKQGEVSLRGSILDIFPINAERAFRIDYFGDEIDTIKFLDIETQRSSGDIESLTVMPAKEIFFSETEKETIRFYINDRLEDNTISDETKKKFKKDLEELDEFGRNTSLRKYLSIFIQEDYSFLDYLNEKTVCFFDYNSIKNQEVTIVNEVYNYLSNFRGYLRPQDFMNSLNSYLTKIDDKIVYYIESKPDLSNDLTTLFSGVTTYEGKYDVFLMDINSLYKGKTVLLSLSKKTHEIVSNLLSNNGIKYNEVSDVSNVKKDKINLFDCVFPSISIPDENIVSINEDNIFKSKKGSRARYNIQVESKRLKSITELKEGDYVVHYDYGIGQFVGIETMYLSGKASDFIHLKYDGSDALYVPVETISVLSKYTAEEGYIPKLSKIGSKEWEKAKSSAIRKASDLADRLLKLYAEREKTEGFRYLPDDETQKEFEDDFGFDLTKDQYVAINDIKHDMVSGRLMDRLVCGDVGFGKTEVAMRAAFKAVLSGKQVAVLTPTTILARQHYLTFKDRMDKFAVEVGLLNRFVSTKESKNTVKKLSEGTLDIIIGTHRILSKDINFHDLGLLIIDEEQKFGVEAKEKITQLKKTVDVLTLTATPIPRTLQMSVSGLKSISLIESAPKGRYPVQTYVLERNDYVVKDAIERELSKGGQVFYLYNRIQDMERVYNYVHGLVPEAKIAFVHGQMTKTEIEETMDQFENKEIDILVSTTIIENGIDIPNVNTLIVHDAERYGLSQLYQIKGRVGRSDKISYAYLMYTKEESLTLDAKKRLQAIKDFTELGSGFKIAVRDLTTRGAGEILGKEQSGFINKVGMEFYFKLLDDEIKKKKGEVVEEEKNDYKLFMSRHVDPNYISDDYAKIEAHTKISKLKSEEELISLKTEFEDRYGEVKPNLLEYMYSKLFENLLNKVKLERYDISDKRAAFVLTKEKSETADGASLFKYSTDISKNFHFFRKLGRIYIEYSNSSADNIEMYRNLSKFFERCINDFLL